MPRACCCRRGGGLEQHTGPQSLFAGIGQAKKKHGSAVIVCPLFLLFLLLLLLLLFLLLLFLLFLLFLVETKTGNPLKL